MLVMKTLSILLAVTSAISFAQDINSRISNTFSESFQNKDLKCYYYQPKVNALVSPKHETSFSDGQISRDFSLEYMEDEIDFTFKLYKENSVSKYEISFNNALTYQGELTSKNFYRLMEFGDAGFFVSGLSYKNGDQSLYTKYNLNKIKCNLELAKSKPIVLEGNQHVNVHPHTRYDYFSLLSLPVSRYFQTMKSYVLIDAANRQGAFIDYGAFLSSGSYTTPFSVFETKMEIPQNIPMLISPAGYNDYEFSNNPEVNITLTGGNHNYCIWNNTRNILWGLFYSKESPVLNITYDTKATVVQRRGIIPGISFKKKHVKGSNVLADIFKRNPYLKSSYHKAYNYYFQKDFLLRFTGVFKTLTYSYNADGLQVNEVIHGSGTRDLVINLNYL